MRLPRAEEIETLSYRTVVELNGESRLAPERQLAAIARRPNAPNGWPTSGPGGSTAASSSALPAATAANAPAGHSRRRGRWLPMPADPTGPERPNGEARFRADLTAYLNSLFLHEFGELLGELPEPTRVALMHELSERGSAWARLPDIWL